MAAATREASGQRTGRASRLLLTALLADDPEARSAWREWKETPGDPSPDEVRLLPAAFLRLGSLGLRSDEWYGTCAEAYRATWRRTELLLRGARSAVEALAADGIPFLPLKGSALVDRCYRDRGLRPMLDLDLLVPPDRFEGAVRILAAAGWKARATPPSPRLLLRHAATVVNPSGQEIDLHWTPSPSDEDPLALWRSSRPASFAGVEAREADSADLLLHVVEHATRLPAQAQASRLLDVATILRAEPIRWDEVVARSVERQLAPSLAGTLRSLARMPGIRIPEEVLALLSGVAPSSLRRDLHGAGLAWEGRSRPPSRVRTRLLELRIACSRLGVGRGLLRYTEVVRFDLAARFAKERARDGGQGPDQEPGAGDLEAILYGAGLPRCAPPAPPGLPTEDEDPRQSS